MKIIEKLTAKAKDNANREGVTIAFLGDSVTQGCFEIYWKTSDAIDTVYDKQNSYAMGVFDILCLLYPSVPVNIINAGISGDNAPSGLGRLERDVLRHEPDLTVVCYGLNDCSRDGPQRYIAALEGIFTQLRSAGSEIIFMTPNMMAPSVSYRLDPTFVPIAENVSSLQTDGTFDAHIEQAKQLCQRMSVPVCDCYTIWKTLWENGVDVTELLSNRINHPVRPMTKLFAAELVKTMFTA